MKSKENEFNFGILKLLIPVIIGFVVIIFLFLKEFKYETLLSYRPGLKEAFFLLVALLFMLLRDVGMTWRFRIISDNQLSMKSALNVHLLSEFTTAVTPAAIGGSSLVMLFLKKEGVDFGKGIAITLINLFLDELFFIIICPIILFFVPFGELFNNSTILTGTINTLFWSVYFGFVLWTAIIFVGLFIRPTIITNMISLIFNFRFLRKWKPKSISFISNLLTASVEIRHQKIGFWLRLFGLTVLTWSARFLVVNMLFLAFQSHINHWIVYGRQIILWMVIHLTPTPGGSGFYEYMFKYYYSDIISNASQLLIIIAVWRIITYYIYLIAGTFIIPNWLKSGSK